MVLMSQMTENNAVIKGVKSFVLGITRLYSGHRRDSWLPTQGSGSSAHELGSETSHKPALRRGRGCFRRKVRMLVIR